MRRWPLCRAGLLRFARNDGLLSILALELLQILVVGGHDDGRAALVLARGESRLVALHRPVEGVEVGILAIGLGIGLRGFGVGVGLDDLGLLVALGADRSGLLLAGGPHPFVGGIERRS